MARLTQTIQRLVQSAVVWSWAMNALRLTSGLVVLPLLIHHLSAPDFGMYFVLLGLAAMIPVLDFGFAVSIGRAVSYAMGGATELKPQSLALTPATSSPNISLLWQLLETTRRVYRWLTLGTLVLLGTVGTTVVALRVGETSVPMVTWVAWVVTLTAAVWEIYAGWWNVYLRSMDRVLISTRQVAMAQAIKIALSCILLMGGAGLLAVPLASLVASVIQRMLSRRTVLRLLGDTRRDDTADKARPLISTLWPNTWRLGVYFLGTYLNGYAYVILAPLLFGLADGAKFSLTLQLLTICSSMAQVWTFVKWPMVGQKLVQQDFLAIRRILRPRLCLQLATYVVLATFLLFTGSLLLAILDSEKSLLSRSVFTLLAVYGLLELHCSFWNTLISTANRLPMVWPTLTANFVSLTIALCLVGFTNLGMTAFALSPLLVGIAYNHWKWPREGARSIGTTWWRFLFRAS